MSMIFARYLNKNGDSYYWAMVYNKDKWQDVWDTDIEHSVILSDTKITGIHQCIVDKVINQYLPNALEDLESLVVLGKLERSA